MSLLSISGHSPLIAEALQSDEVEQLEDIISLVVDMHVKAEALISAVKLRKAKAVKVLVDAGCDPFLKQQGRTALYWAVRYEDTDILLLLLSHIDKDGCSELTLCATHLCCGEECRPKRRLMAKSKRAINEALFDAAAHCSNDCLDTLLTFGGDPNMYFYHDDEFLSWCTPLIAACYAPISHTKPNCGEERVLPIVRSLVTRGADICKGNHLGDTALHWSAAACLLQTSQLLLRNGADVDHKNSMGKTPLMSLLEQAVSCETCDRLSMLEILLHWGALVNDEDGDQWTALHYAVNSACVDLVDLLLRYGARPDKLPYKSIPCTTPLFLAVSAKQFNITKLLVQHQADVNVCCGFQNDIKSPFQRACETMDAGIVRLLMLSGASQSTTTCYLGKLSSELNTSFLPASDVDEWKALVELAQQPLQLKHLCRLTIRTALLLHTEGLSNLPLPPTIVSYLKFEDL